MQGTAEAFDALVLAVESSLKLKAAACLLCLNRLALVMRPQSQRSAASGACCGLWAAPRGICTGTSVAPVDTTRKDGKTDVAIRPYMPKWGVVPHSPQDFDVRTEIPEAPRPVLTATPLDVQKVLARHTSLSQAQHANASNTPTQATEGRPGAPSNAKAFAQPAAL